MLWSMKIVQTTIQDNQLFDFILVHYYGICLVIKSMLLKYLPTLII